MSRPTREEKIDDILDNEIKNCKDQIKYRISDVKEIIINLNRIKKFEDHKNLLRIIEAGKDLVITSMLIRTLMWEKETFEGIKEVKI